MENLKEALGAEKYSEIEGLITAHNEKYKADEKKQVKLTNLRSGGYVDIEKYNGVVKDKEAISGQLKTANGEIEKFKGMKIEDIQAAVTDYKTKFENSETARAKDIEALKFDYQLMDELKNKYKAKNPKAVKALIPIDKLSRTDDGILGLKDIMEPLQKSDGYLFDVEDENNKNFGVQNKNASPIVKGVKSYLDDKYKGNKYYKG